MLTSFLFTTTYSFRCIGQLTSLFLLYLGYAEDEHLEEPKYPIDDLLVHPTADDPVLAQRPSPSRDFNIPMDCIGDVLMVWDFCSCFSRLLHLWPFSLDDFENALCHKDSNVILIVESHSALLRLLMKDDREYLLATQKKKRKPKVEHSNSYTYAVLFLLFFFYLFSFYRYIHIQQHIFSRAFAFCKKKLHYIFSGIL